MQKVRSLPGSDYRRLAIRFDQDSRFLVNRNVAGVVGPAVLHQARKKSQGPSHAIALGEVTVGNYIVEIGNLEEVAN